MSNYKPVTIAVFSLGFALLLAMVSTVAPVHAGDPDGVIGPMDIDLFKCLEREDDDGNKVDPYQEISIDQEREEIKKESVGKYDEDIASLEKVCRKKGNDSILVPIEETKIEGYVYEFHPVDPSNPAESEWFAVPSQDVPVVAEGVSFEIFWGSEPNGYFYYYKTRFGKGPIILNLRLPPDAHPINPNIVIESSGLEETWTVFLGFYRGDVPPPDVTVLRTPDGNFLPFTNSNFDSYKSIVGLDGKSALPGVGGVLLEQNSTTVSVLAVLLLIVLPAAGVVTLRNRQKSHNL